MATVTSDTSPPSPVSVPSHWTVADMHKKLGRISLERILAVPPPGTATVEDVEKVRIATGRICELVDGTLVEKTVGYYESRLAVVLCYFLERFLDDRDLGIVLGPDGTLKILSAVVRAADVSFIRWERLHGQELPAEPIPDLVPDLAVEVLSRGNTRAEMKRKLGEYFTAGVRLVWFIEPKTRKARVYTSPDHFVVVDADGTLSGGDVLPGFELSLKELFARADRRKPKTSP